MSGSGGMVACAAIANSTMSAVTRNVSPIRIADWTMPSTPFVVVMLWKFNFSRSSWVKAMDDLNVSL